MMGQSTPATQGLLSISEAAAHIGVSVGLVRDWTNQGVLRCIRLPSGQRRFYRADVDRFVASLPTNEAAS